MQKVRIQQLNLTKSKKNVSDKRENSGPEKCLLLINELLKTFAKFFRITVSCHFSIKKTYLGNTRVIASQSVIVSIDR